MREIERNEHSSDLIRECVILIVRKTVAEREGERFIERARERDWGGTEKKYKGRREYK